MSFVHRMRSAFSLIEVLVATVIMSIVAASIHSIQFFPVPWNGRLLPTVRSVFHV
ncbi:MAG: Uncharacterised protein [SAR116 cluster bacterium]|nr:MAG: Uncharacterised protein [SAR116 cluster bacterium]